MTTEQYYSALKEKHEKTDWNNRESIREYNEFARCLRSMMEWERGGLDDGCGGRSNQ